MSTNFIRKSISILFARQTSILSAAVVIMSTVILSQVLGLFRQRLLVSIFGASNELGIYLASVRLPDLLFQIIIAGALSSAFIPVFSDFLTKGKEKEGYKFASTLLFLSMIIFLFVSIILIIFANFFSHLIAPGFTNSQLSLMANLMRIILIGELFFILGSFLSAILQSYNHFFIPGIAAALYNLGIIIGIVFLSKYIGIYSAAWGSVLGAFIFVVMQIPLSKKIGFSFSPSLFLKQSGILEIFHLMWPRTISIAIFQLGTLFTVTLVSFLPNPGRNYVIFDYAQTLAFAPIVLFGQTIAQAAFPVLSRERERLEEFKETFFSSFSQMLYLVLPVSVLFLVLRIPIVRLLYGTGQFDWQATVLTGRTLAILALSIFAQALVYLISRGFYALHDTKTPLIIGGITTLLMVILGLLSVFVFHLDIMGIAFSYTIAAFLNFLFLFLAFIKKIGGFKKISFFFGVGKIFLATFFTGFALYIPIKLLDQLVFDTTKTINLLILTGISSFIGLSLYLFLTWLFNVSQAYTFLFIFKKIGNWKEVLTKTNEVLDVNHPKP